MQTCAQQKRRKYPENHMHEYIMPAAETYPKEHTEHSCSWVQSIVSRRFGWHHSGFDSSQIAQITAVGQY